MNLLFIMKNENLLQNFKLECIDGRVESFSGFLTKVPTMILAGHNKYLVCEEIFDWVKNIRFIKYNRTMNVGDKNVEMYNGFSEQEMGQMSDTYTTQDPNSSMPLPQSFFGFGREKSNMIYTPPKDHKITEAEQTKLIQEESMLRERDNTAFNEIAKKGQIEAMINQEKYDLMQEMQSGM